MRIPDPIRPYAYLAAWVLAAIVVLFGLSKLSAWDKQRLADAREAGVLAERAEWTSGQRQADAAQRAARDASDDASFKASDTMRDGIAADRSTAQEATQATVDTITQEKANAPRPVCHPDGRPDPIPGRVLDALDTARGRAVGSS